MNDAAFLHRVLARARDAGLDVRVFGGWAEELHGLVEPRQHGDVDLLCVADDMSRVDRFVAEHGEVVEKRFRHKRACVIDGVLVELFLVRGLATPFPGGDHRWPADTFDDPIVASKGSVLGYRRLHEILTRPG